MNKIILSGYIANDVELKTTQQGTSVTKFNLAVKRPRSKNGDTDFIPIVCWRNTAEFVAKYFSKGDGIELSGMLTIRKYQDRDGNNRYATEVVSDDVEFPKTKKSSDGNYSDNETRNQTASTTSNADYNSDDFTELSDEDLPF